MAADDPSFLTRFFFAFACFFRVLSDGAFAGAARALASGAPAPTPTPPATPPAPAAPAPKQTEPAPPRPPAHESALAFLALLQREGRLIDFLEEDVQSFPDADLGAAARVVHAGCRKALREHVKLEPVRSEAEGARLTLPAGFDARETKLTGNVSGEGPFSGTLQHRGYRAVEITLPAALEGHDARVVAQAEVEL
ncbi:MAG TPA: DUF2760 domain-containing protein [Polyangiaceae bacterium]|nr:DUF2760 domain-containing protein [Polyangiaceae bacterium]